MHKYLLWLHGHHLVLWHRARQWVLSCPPHPEVRGHPEVLSYPDAGKREVKFLSVSAQAPSPPILKVFCRWRELTGSPLGPPSPFTPCTPGSPCRSRPKGALILKKLVLFKLVCEEGILPHTYSETSLSSGSLWSLGSGSSSWSGETRSSSNTSSSLKTDK